MIDKLDAAGLYGSPPRELATLPVGAIQYAPFLPGAAVLEDLAQGSASNMVMLAPPGTIERRCALALALRALAPGAPLTVLALKDKGGSRIRKELEVFGCDVSETSKCHHRICRTVRPSDLVGLDQAIVEGAPRFVEPIGFWSQPGIFSWDRIDPGSALLARHLPALSGRGADFGCGFGFLARKVLATPEVRQLLLIDIDRRAINAAKKNVDDPRASFIWDDVRKAGLASGSLDFVVMNPPFHDGGAEDKVLGQNFIKRAAEVLRPGGVCWLTANRHLPYEAALTTHFASAVLKADSGGYKIYEARR